MNISEWLYNFIPLRIHSPDKTLSPFQGVDEGHRLNGELILILIIILIYYLIECFIDNDIQLEETSFHSFIKYRTSLVI
jgi:hypothetical protein